MAEDRFRVAAVGILVRGCKIDAVAVRKAAREHTGVIERIQSTEDEEIREAKTNHERNGRA